MSAVISTPRAILRAAMIGAVALLGGCSDTAEWTPAESSHKTTVEWVVFDHAIDFGSGNARLTPSARTSLERFLGEIEIAPTDQVLVGAAAAPTSEGQAQLADQRSDSVIGALRSRRIFADFLPSDASAGTWDGKITVQVGRWVMTLPNCGTWNKSPGITHDNRRLANFGCATVANTNVHLVDPGDLVRGRDPGPTSAEGSTYYLMKWRQGERQRLPIVRPSGGFETTGREVK